MCNNNNMCDDHSFPTLFVIPCVVTCFVLNIKLYSYLFISFHYSYLYFSPLKPSVCLCLIRCANG